MNTMQNGLEVITTSEVTEEHLRLGKIIWDYMLLRDPLQKSDVIILMGNCDIRTAEYASELFLQGWADWLVISGDRSPSTPGTWKSEAEVFKKVALKMNVPECKIVMETQSCNTGENVKMSYDIMKSHGIKANKIIAVQMPFMERRVYATIIKQWPGKTDEMHLIVKSPDISMEDYPALEVGTLSVVIAKMVGSLQRIIEYPALGFHIYQDVPEDVLLAYRALIQIEKFRKKFI